MCKRVTQKLLAIMLGLALAACTDSVLAARGIPDAHGLAGTWASAPDALGSYGWHRKTLVLEADGRFAATSAGHGLYEGQQRDDPSAWTRIEGTFRVEGERLHFTPKLMTWWDHFETPHSRVPRVKPYPWGSIFDDATFALEGNTLRLEFNVFPADMPVPVTAIYERASAARAPR